MTDKEEMATITSLEKQVLKQVEEALRKQVEEALRKQSEENASLQKQAKEMYSLLKQLEEKLLLQKEQVKVVKKENLELKDKIHTQTKNKIRKYKESDREIAISKLEEQFPYLENAISTLRDAKENGTKVQINLDDGKIVTKNYPKVEVYYAPTQAGKTKASLNVAYISILLGLSAVFISMNSLSQGRQLKKRVTEYNNLSFNKSLKKMKRDRRIPIIKFAEIKNSYAKNNNGKTDLKKFDEEASTNEHNRTLLNMLNGSEPGLIWCMGNSSRMTVLRTLLKKCETDYTLIGDEFDQLVPYDNDRVMDKYYSRIHKDSYMVTGATATSIKVWLNSSINFQTVTSLPIPAEYVGFKDFAIETLPFDCSALTTKDDESDSMREICDYLELLIDKDGYTNLTNKVTGATGCNHPLHILVNVSRNMNIHRAIFEPVSYTHLTLPTKRIV